MGGLHCSVGESLPVVSSCSDCRRCKESPLWFVFYPPVNVLLADRELCQQGTLLRTHLLCLPGGNPTQASFLFPVCDWCRGSVECNVCFGELGVALTISTQAFITACTHRHAGLRSERTHCHHSQDAPNWDKMKSVKT